MTVVPLLALAVMLSLGSAKPAYAATPITVNTASDEAVTDGQCSLREAINNANANSDTTGGDCAAGSPGADTIDLSSLNGAITLGSDLPTISDDLTISGPLASTQVIDAHQNADHVFAIGAGITATLRSLIVTGASNGSGIVNYGTLTLNSGTVTDNAGGTSGAGAGILNFDKLTLNNSTVSHNMVGANGFGGGIFNALSAAALTVNNSTIRDNAAASGGGIVDYGDFVVVTVNGSAITGNSAGFPDVAGNGGGIYGGGSLSITDSTISGNTAHNGGGGIYNSGTLTVADSTISTNTATFGSGGGIFNSSSVVNIVNSTIAGNTADAGGGIADEGGGYGTGRLTLDYSTITGNNASSGGSGIFEFFSPTETLSDSIVAGNPGGNCLAIFGSGGTDAGYNLEDGRSCGFSNATSLSNTDPLLDPDGLKDNGGST
jgi:CSLREA domain-containing protein